MNIERIYDLYDNEEVKTAKYAVTYENGEVFQHFGRTPAFKVYEVPEKKVQSSEESILICL